MENVTIAKGLPNEIIKTNFISFNWVYVRFGEQLAKNDSNYTANNDVS